MQIIRIILIGFKSIKDLILVKLNPVEYARSLGVEVGNNVRLISIKPGNGTFGSEPYLVKIGDHVTVTGAVQFVTHDGGVWVFREKEPDIDVFGQIKVGNNVFIGYGAVLMPGVTIGNNVVIGAMSVVTKDVDDDCVVAGVPAKKIYDLNEYYQIVSKKKENIRDFGKDEKREYLLNKFGSISEGVARAPWP